IKGAVPSPRTHPPGCRFHPRCPFSTAECHTDMPQMRELRPGHTVRCHWAEKILEGNMERHEVETFAVG
ncbi:MAG: dipeptide/oligopeptide/nickel ABC transporter ATP-binding protein, partial [Candidatus Sumerlaeia bacterium]|nr:dipeptide/oligopeptide/nickel ABC transporter ATP-binding protein [Candidatus Sumerlaeia bacterium]